MENKYNKVMDKLEVTKEMEERMIHRLHKLGVKQASHKKPPFSSYRKYATLAACFLFILVGSVIGYNYLQPKAPQTVMDSFYIAEFDSTKELSASVGFTMKEITQLPYTAEETLYKKYGKDLAEVTYMAGEKSTSLRMFLGHEDISGDYNVYSLVKEVEMNGSRVTVKGDEGQFVLAIWQEGEYSYAIQLREPILEDQLLLMVGSVR